MSIAFKLIALIYNSADRESIWEDECGPRILKPSEPLI
jgi:hypothetical protein